MIEITSLTLLRPLWLLAIPVAALVAIWAIRRRGRLAGWDRVIDPKLALVLEELGHIVSSRSPVRITLILLVISVTALALAGPASRSTSAPAFRNLDVVILAIDMSKSMTQGGALDEVKAAAAQVLAGSSGRPVALLLFAADAYLASVPTEDPKTLSTMIGVLDGETMPDTGSRPDKALRLAHQMLSNTRGGQGQVLLLSDGGGIGAEALHEAGLLRGIGARVTAVSVTPSEAPFGMPAPRPDALSDLARLGGGEVIDIDNLGALHALLQAPPSSALDAVIAALTFDDHGRNLLILALLPLISFFRKDR